MLWVQDVFKQHISKDSRNKLFKVHTLQNPADVLTKYSTPAVIQRHLDKLGLQDTINHSIQCVFTDGFMQVFNAASDFSEDDFQAVHVHSRQQHKHTTARFMLCLFSV